VIPVGKYNGFDAVTQALSIGNNLWDFAPIVAFTFVSPLLIADGTEVSAKFYWNKLSGESGDALSHRLAHQYRLRGVGEDRAIPGRHRRLLCLPGGGRQDQRRAHRAGRPQGRGPAARPRAAYDMAEQAASIKVKVLQTVITANTVKGTGAALTIVKKFQ
jgi:hypothetical protein